MPQTAQGLNTVFIRIVSVHFICNACALNFVDCFTKSVDSMQSTDIVRVAAQAQ
jgi:hypothetical protein